MITHILYANEGKTREAAVYKLPNPDGLALGQTWAVNLLSPGRIERTYWVVKMTRAQAIARDWCMSGFKGETRNGEILAHDSQDPTPRKEGKK